MGAQLSPVKPHWEFLAKTSSSREKFFNGNYFSVYNIVFPLQRNQGPVVRSIVSLTSSLRVISLTVLADSIYNILIFFAEKM